MCMFKNNITKRCEYGNKLPWAYTNQTVLPMHVFGIQYVWDKAVRLPVIQAHKTESLIGKHSPKTDKYYNVYQMSGCNHELPKGSEIRSSPDSTPRLAQRWADRSLSVGPTLANTVGATSGCPLGQRCTNVTWLRQWSTVGQPLRQRQLTAGGPPLAQRWANGRSPLGQRQVSIGPTLAQR